MKTKKPVIGIIGAGENATDKMLSNAFELGKLIAENDWILINGGRKAGVMEASSKGAHSNKGLVIGILPDGMDVSSYISVSIDTGMGYARNNIIVRSSDVVVSLGGGAGTISEMSLALKANKPLILFNLSEDINKMFQELDGKDLVMEANSPDQVIEKIRSILP